MLEIAWSVIPFLITMVIFVWGASVFFAMSRPPDETLNIYVVGKQWMWKFQHLDGQREINELHVPVGRPVKLIMTSEDVIHDFFVPAFRIKADVIPGRYTTSGSSRRSRHVSPVLRRVLRHAALGDDRPGRRHGAERLPGLAERRRAGRIARRRPAQKLFADLACNTCHRPDAQGRGPVLQGLFGKTVELTSGETRRRRRGLHPRIDSQPGGEDHRRLPADHADVSGAGQRRSGCSS